MNKFKCMILTGLTLTIFLTPSLLSDWNSAESQNSTLSNDTNNTRPVWNMKDRTITLVNPTTNETEIIGNFTVNPGNMTTNETLTNMGNVK